MQVEEYEHKGLHIEIQYDQDAESPRNWDNAGKLMRS